MTRHYSGRSKRDLLISVFFGACDIAGPAYFGDVQNFALSLKLLDRNDANAKMMGFRSITIQFR
jgi:hypothetical protein